MAGVGRYVRRYGIDAVLASGLIVLAVMWLRPVSDVDGASLACAEVGREVTVKVVGIEPLRRRYAIAWLDGRPLVLYTDGKLPRGPEVSGAIELLGDPPARWLDRSLDFYPRMLDVRNGIGAAHRINLALLAALLLLPWGYRLYRWGWADRKPPFALQLEVAQPRLDATVAAALRRHGVLPYVLVFLACLVTLGPISGMIAANAVFGAHALLNVGDYMLVLFAACGALVSPLWLVPFVVWTIRRRGQLARVVRHGDITHGRVMRVVSSGGGLGGARGMRTHLWLSAQVGDETYLYKLSVSHCLIKRDAPTWAIPAFDVRMLVSGDERFAIVLSPTGTDHLAHRVQTAPGELREWPRAHVVERAE
ncbi:MAG TPA: hypothetical protein VFP84_33755 [Kofleriaceae bacterium]|nr:hypothetical protein [Kofleriaceae bacterium]